jgi:hypothetical protein
MPERICLCRMTSLFSGLLLCVIAANGQVTTTSSTLAADSNDLYRSFFQFHDQFSTWADQKKVQYPGNGSAQLVPGSYLQTATHTLLSGPCSTSLNQVMYSFPGNGTSQYLPATITSVSPATAAIGATVPITVTGRGLGGVTSLAISGSGVLPIISTTSASDTQLTGSVSVPSNASVGTQSIYASNANGGGSTDNSNGLSFAVVAGANPQLISPAGGTVLTNSPVTFVWNSVAGAQDYWIDVGSSPNQGNISGRYTGGVTQATVDLSLYLTGQTIYVQLYSKYPSVNLVPGTGSHFQFVTLAIVNPQLISPASGTVLINSPVTFVWNSVAGAQDYWIDVGTSPSQGNISGRYTGGATQATVDLSQYLTSQTMYVQLYSKFPNRNLVAGTGNHFQFAASLQGGDFTLSTPPPQTVPAGQSVNGIPETISPVNGFNTPVNLAWTNSSSWPTGLSASFGQDPVTSSTTISLTTTSGTPAGTYTLAFSGTGGGRLHTSSFTVQVGGFNWQPMQDVRLIALDTGDVYGYFSNWVQSSDYCCWTNLMQNAQISGPGGNSWGPSSGSSTTDTTRQS